MAAGTQPLRELLALFSVELDPEGVKKAEEKIDSLTNRLKALGEIVSEVLVLKKIGAFFGDMIEAGARVNDLSQRLGIGAQAMQRFQFAAGLVGADAEGAARSLGMLNRQIGQAEMGKRDAVQAFAAIGISISDLKGKKVDEVLGQVAEGIAKIPEEGERAAIAMKLFGRNGQILLPLLQQGKKGIDEAAKAFREMGGGMSDQFVADAKKAQVELLKLKLGFTNLKSELAEAAMPTIMLLLGLLKEAVHVFHDVAQQTDFLRHSFEIAAVVGVLKLVQSLGKLAKAFGLLKPSIWETLAAFGEFLIPIAIIGALVLLVDDLWTAMEGGQSVIGDVLTSLLGIQGKGEFIEELNQAFSDLKDLLSDLKPILNSLFQATLYAIPLVVEGFLGIIVAVKTLIDLLKTTLDLIIDVTSLPFTGDAAPIGNDLAKNGGKISRDFGLLGGLVGGTLHGDAGPEGLQQAHLANSAVREPTSIVVHNANDINVQVQGGPDAERTGKAIGQGVATKLERTNLNALTAVTVP